MNPRVLGPRLLSWAISSLLSLALGHVTRVKAQSEPAAYDSASTSPALEAAADPAEPVPTAPLEVLQDDPAPAVETASAAAGDTPELAEARERLTRGEQLFQAGDFASARAEFMRAYALLAGHPKAFLVLYNIAQTQQWEYDYVAAIATYRRYLDEGGDAVEERTHVEATIALLSSLLAYVDIAVTPQNAELWIDGQKRGTGSGRLPVAAGRHLLEAHADGYQSVRRELSLGAGESSTIALELQSSKPRFPGLAPAYFWSASALGGGLLVAGGTLGLVALERRSELEAKLDDPATRWDVREAERSSVVQSAKTADVLLISAGVVALGALVLGLLTDWEPGQK